MKVEIATFKVPKPTNNEEELKFLKFQFKLADYSNKISSKEFSTQIEFFVEYDADEIDREQLNNFVKKGY